MVEHLTIMVIDHWKYITEPCWICQSANLAAVDFVCGIKGKGQIEQMMIAMVQSKLIGIRLCKKAPWVNGNETEWDWKEVYKGDMLMDSLLRRTILNWRSSISKTSLSCFVVWRNSWQANEICPLCLSSHHRNERQGRMFTKQKSIICRHYEISAWQ